MRNVDVLSADRSSILHLYRRLLVARRASAALREGAFAFLDAPAGVLAWQRVAGHDRRAIVVNMSSVAVDVPLPGSWTVEVASDGAGEGTPHAGVVPADGAVVLRPS
jgi:alpha-glucosidase